jgi:paraquat-inducible protein B
MLRTLTELKDAARSIRVLADYLERHPESLLRGKPQEAAR